MKKTNVILSAAKNLFFLILILFLFIPAQTTAQVQGAYKYYSCTESDSLTSAIDLNGKRLLSITPDDSTAGTVLYLWHSNYSDSTFSKVQYDGSDLSVTFVAGKTAIMKPWETTSLFRYIKIEYETVQTDTSIGRIGYGKF